MALTKSTKTVKDAAGSTVTVITCNDATNDGPATGVLGADGTHFLPSGDAVGREIYVLQSSTAFSVLGTFTRPANVTAYTALDVVGGAITFTAIGASGGHVLLTEAHLRLDIAAIPSGMTSFRLYLYDVTPPSAIADNAAFDIASGDRASYLGYIDLGTVQDIGSTLLTAPINPALQIKLNGSANVFGYLVTAGAFTPANNSEVYNIALRSVGI